VQVNITNLIDDAQCSQTVRELRWPKALVHESLHSALTPVEPLVMI
jgi:hypothetical protein